MENIQNEEDILQDATRAVFNCGTSFSEAKVVSLTDEFNPQPTLQTQRTNPEYQEETRSLLVGHFKEMALEDLIEQQDYQNRYKQTDPELDQDNESENNMDNEYTSRPPEPRPW